MQYSYFTFCIHVYLVSNIIIKYILHTKNYIIYIFLNVIQYYYAPVFQKHFRLTKTSKKKEKKKKPCWVCWGQWVRSSPEWDPRSEDGPSRSQSEDISCVIYKYDLGPMSFHCGPLQKHWPLIIEFTGCWSNDWLTWMSCSFVFQALVTASACSRRVM